MMMAIDLVINSTGLAQLPSQLPVVISATIFLQALFNYSKYFLNFLFPHHFEKLSKLEKREMQSYFISFLVSLFLITSSLKVVLDEGFRRDPVNYWNSFSLRVCAIANGYFIWDIIFCLNNNHGLTFTIHGLIGFLVTLIGFKPTMHYFGASGFLYELSTPFLNINYFIMKSGLKGSKLHLINGLLLLLTYFLARICWGTYFTISTIGLLLSQGNELSLGISSTLIIVCLLSLWLNTFWFCKLIGKALQMLNNSKSN